MEQFLNKKDLSKTKINTKIKTTKSSNSSSSTSNSSTLNSLSSSLSSIKLAVVGSREFNDYDYLKKSIDILQLKYNICEIVSGGARGADSFGEQYAKDNGIPTKIFYPEWSKYGRSAGFRRNKDIVECADIVIAFWDRQSKGTLSSINLAKKSQKT